MFIVYYPLGNEMLVRLGYMWVWSGDQSPISIGQLATGRTTKVAQTLIFCVYYYVATWHTAT